MYFSLGFLNLLDFLLKLVLLLLVLKERLEVTFKPLKERLINNIESS